MTADATPWIPETEPAAQDVRVIDERLYDYSAARCGIDDGKYLTMFIRDDGGAVIGGTHGWTWGATCYVQLLFIPETMRRRGRGTALMRAVEAEARARGCTQIVVETHDFQAPQFYAGLGFVQLGGVPDYPRGHSRITMRKQLG
jgi:GNAT superfamily N-acetyltransferase